MKKNRSKPFTASVELLYEEEMNELADAIAESKSEQPAFSDPFEDYIDVVRTKIHANPHIFRLRLTKGYNSLLSALPNEEISSY
jgi:hypothetical protein